MQYRERLGRPAHGDEPPPAVGERDRTRAVRHAGGDGLAARDVDQGCTEPAPDCKSRGIGTEGHVAEVVHTVDLAQHAAVGYVDEREREPQDPTVGRDEDPSVGAERREVRDVARVIARLHRAVAVGRRRSLTSQSTTERSGAVVASTGAVGLQSTRIRPHPDRCVWT